MDTGPVVAAIGECVGGRGRGRGALAGHLARLRSGIQAQQAAQVPAAAVLAQAALAAARVFGPGVELADRERELALECVRDALGAAAALVPSVVVDHVARIVAAHLAGPGGGRAEPARAVAVEAWRRLAANVATVAVPRGAARGAPVDAVPLREYVGVALPRDYLALVLCALLDTAEAAEDQRLRAAALRALAETLGPSRLVGPAQAERVFPGTASALARIALAQPPPPGGPLDAAVQRMSLAARRPTAAVRAAALDALAAAVVLVYGGRGAPAHAAPDAAHWAERARSVLAGDSDGDSDGDEKPKEEEAIDGADGGHRQIRQILWRLAGLRHTDGLGAALVGLFSAVSLGCPRLGADRTAVEACLAIAGAQPELKAASVYARALARRCDADRRLGTCVAAVLEQTLPLFGACLRVGADHQRADVLHVIAGCVAALGADRARPLLGPWWAAHGLPALLDSLAVSLPGTSLLIADASEPEPEPEAEAPAVAYVLDQYRSAGSARALERFVDCVADVIAPQTLCAQLLDRLLLSAPAAMPRPPALWLLTRVARRPPGLGHAGQSVFQYCVDCLGALPAGSGFDGGKDESGSTALGTLDASMVLDVVAAATPGVGPSVAYCLDTLLFPLLQTLAAETPLLRRQAQRALHVLAQTMGAGGVAAMLRANVDYIVEGCSRQIRAAALHPHVFDILTGAVHQVGRDILPFMDDVVEDTLDVCEAAPDDAIATCALQFLEAVTRTIAGEAALPQIEPPPVAAAEDPVATALAEMAAADEGRLLLLGERVSSDLAIASSDLTETAGSGQTVDDDQTPPGSPLAIKIALAVQSFLSSESGAQQLVALKTVSNALGALRDSRDLLPLINEVWPALAHRLDGARDAHYVVLAACDVVERVCALGAAWMRQRVRDDLCAPFLRILRDAASAASAASAAAGGSWSWSRSEAELAARVLRTMATVAARVPLDDRAAWDVVVAAAALLGRPPLEPPALGLLRAMAPLYGDKIWLVLARLGAARTPPRDIPPFALPPAIRPPPPGICDALGLI
ncbi:hypothetical protein H4R18_005105 [Coemansia javaensis]|uniref:TTI1 C-terminal TPR domain-containing protein n=1 Tax=Coemansia javaensis TaxID=2761396 RepID=A0A9W8H725_9FUNG|nr:hypothetical protein H4R18_005105 [Coemansia javaensis]